MATFDVYIRKVADFLEEIRRNGRQVREFDASGDPSEVVRGLPIRVGSEANPGIILRGDTFAELGSPDAGSCAFPLWTNDLSLIRDGAVTLIGPGVQESGGASLPFGQVLIIGGKDIGTEEHSALEQNQYVSDQIEGYMVRSVPGRMWSRVSRDAAGKGFDFEILGKSLMAVFKLKMPKIEAMEIIFVTSGKEDLEPLNEIARQVQQISKNIVREAWLAKGYDILECTLDVDCGSCSSKPVCDDIREVVKVRKKKGRETREAASE